MPDHLVGATLADSGVAIFSAITTEIVGEIQRRHDLAPTATAAVGRLVTGAALLSANLKGRERISLQIAGQGPIGGLTADAWLLADDVIGARGYARNPHADLPIDARGKFDVAGAIGAGVLQVTKSYEVGQPYVGVVPLHSGEIAEDVAAYLARSEQIPSVVALGVLANPGGVVAAGGVIAQVLPGTDESAIAQLERRAVAMPPVTAIVAERPEARRLIQQLAGDAELRALRSMKILFACQCTREKVEATLRGLGRDELLRMNEERDRTLVTCEFCGRIFPFTRLEIAELVERV